MPERNSSEQHIAANDQRCQCPTCRRVRELNEELGICFVASVPDDVLERVVEAVAREVYEAECVVFYGGDVGMTYWRDLAEDEKERERERVRPIIEGAIRGVA